MTSSAISPSVTSRLAEIVGAANVASDFAQLAAYEIDRKLPAAAVRPASSEEVAAIVKFAASEKLALVPTGARTKLGIGYAPSRYDLALDMTRLNKVIAYDPGDLTLSVEAGRPTRKTRASPRRASPISAAAGPFRESHHDRRPHRLWRRFPAAPVLRHRARFSARHGIRHRRRRGHEKRRARSEKRHRLRHPQINDRRARHPRRHHARKFQDVSHAARHPRLHRALRHRRKRAGHAPPHRAIRPHAANNGNCQPARRRTFRERRRHRATNAPPCQPT